jgi:hypothetical protein
MDKLNIDSIYLEELVSGNGYHKTVRRRGPNEIETTISSKINEIVELLNKMTPANNKNLRPPKDHYSFEAIEPRQYGVFPCVCGSHNTKWKMRIINFSGCRNYCDNCCELKKNELNGDVKDAE